MRNRDLGRGILVWGGGGRCGGKGERKGLGGDYPLPFFFLGKGVRGFQNGHIPEKLKSAQVLPT